MRVLRCVLLSLVCLSAPVSAEQSSSATPDPAAVAAAHELLEVLGVTKQMDGMVEAMSRGFEKGATSQDAESGKKLSAEFDAGMKKVLAYKSEMIDDFAKLYAETFTIDEMKTVTEFYRSGIGAKFISKTPELMQKGSEIGMKYSAKIVEEMKAGQPAPAAK
jgi:uncharacterized protein